MIRNLTTIEFKGKNDRIYRFLCETDSPLGEIHDVLCQMKHMIVEQILQADKKKESGEAQECQICEEE